MTLYVKTSTPQALLNAFNKAIDEEHIVTWSRDASGDYTHVPDQWKHLGWFRPRVDVGQLTMRFIGRNDRNMTKVVYGVYHGRLAEALLTHHDTMFEDIRTSALYTSDDLVGTASLLTTS